MSRSGRLAVVAWVGSLALMSSCGASSGGQNDGAGGGTATLDVLAAASLTEAFAALAERFEAMQSGVDVRLVLESSTTLASQVTEGAPADVLATADDRSMQLVLDADSAQRADTFATNELVLVTPAANPAGVRLLADLDDPDVSYVACVPTAPCGAVAADLLEVNDVAEEPRSLEVDVKAVLAKVVSDEVDAGLVYASDAKAAGDAVQSFPVPASEERLNRYLVAVVEQADDAGLAAAWVDLLLSDEGQQVLAKAGFGPPQPAESS